MAYKKTYTVQEALDLLQNIEEAESGTDGESEDEWSLGSCSAGSDSDSEQDQPPAKRSRVTHSGGSGDTVQGIIY